MPPLLIDEFGGIASLPNGASVTTTELVVVSGRLSANSLQVGTVVRVTARGTVSVNALPTARIRVGTAGTIADTQVCTAAPTSTLGSISGFEIDGEFVVRSVGTGGTLIGNMRIMQGGGAVNTSAQTTTVAINTTVANFVTLTLIGSATTPVITVTNALVEIVKP